MGCKCCSTSNTSKEIKKCPLCHLESEKIGQKSNLKDWIIRYLNF